MPSFRPSLASDELALAPGDVLGRKYRLERPLGEGAMAVVWVAQNMALETQVAIKILRAGLASDPRLVARFRQEAKATAAIAHKNIVQVYDYGVTSNGAPFIVMELLQGETLAQRIHERGPLPPDEAVRTLMRAMKGVTVAHAKGVIHRDLKPENIFLVREDNGTERPKVLDFGVSFVTRSSSDDRLTKAGGMVGTPSYLPPEAIEGDNRGDVRGDVWALGVILYETLSGQLPFQGKSVHALLEAICKTPQRPLHDLVPGVDFGLQAIVDRAMSKDAAERYPGVRELYDDLNSWLGRQGLLLSAAHPSAVQLLSTGQIPSAARLGLPADPMVDDEGPTLVGPALESVSHLAAASQEKSPSSSREMITRATAPSGDHTPSPEPPRVSVVPGGRGSLGPLWLGGVALAVLALALVSFRVRPPSPLAAPPASGDPALTAAPPLASGDLAAPPASGDPAPTAPASAAPSAASADEAALDVVGLPDRALIRIDDRRVERLPVMIRRGRTVRLRVDAPGYEPWQQEVIIEGSLRLRYAARPVGAAPRTSDNPTYREIPY